MWLVSTIAAMSAVGCYAVRLDALLDRGDDESQRTIDPTDAGTEQTDASPEAAPEAVGEVDAPGDAQKTVGEAAAPLPSWCPAGSRFESEPNDDAAQALVLDGPTVICGVVRPGDEDRMQFPIASAGPIRRAEVSLRAGADANPSVRLQFLDNGKPDKDEPLGLGEALYWMPSTPMTSTTGTLIISASSTGESRYVVRLLP